MTDREGERVWLVEVLAEREEEVVTEGEGVMESVMLDVGEFRGLRDTLPVREGLGVRRPVSDTVEDRQRVGVWLSVIDAVLERRVEGVREPEAETESERLCVSVAAGEALMLAQDETEMLREGEGEGEALKLGEPDERAEREIDTEAVEERVTGCVVPIAEVVDEAAGEREAMEAEDVLVAQGEPERDADTLALRDRLGQAVAVEHTLGEEEMEGVRVGLTEVLAQRETEVVTEDEGEPEGLMLGVGEFRGLRDTLTERDRLRVGQLDAVEEEERHSVGDCDSVAGTLPLTLTVELTE